MSVRNRLGKTVLRLDVAHLNVCQPATSTQMISRTKPPTPSSLSATLSDCSVVATASPRANLAAHLDHADSPQPAIAKTAESSTPDVDPIFLAQEVCQMLKIGKTTLYKLNKSKQLQSFRVTARIRAWRLSAIQAYLASKEAE
ncbi:helix-turn-helix transcriptional regulator [Paraburkholderia tropica]|uniref:helix-turn-helix transcriptional regulator n=1 Tax=Paraburkholderia tropica TaxID=92647 RepID=UPI002AB606C2|nr:helix-turn-helix domain-containing protein [Paraburkholderia tropica]